VSGVGDEAYSVVSGPASMLDFRVGDQIFEIGPLTAGNTKNQYPVSGGHQQKAVAIEKKLALGTVARIRGR
jgi:hypothetical protein